jgi:hypothetical protein
MECDWSTSESYLAEIFSPYEDPGDPRAEVERIRAASTSLAAEGVRVRHLYSIYVTGEETSFHLFEAEGPAAIERALHGAGLDVEHITPTIAFSGSTTRDVPAASGTLRVEPLARR